MDINRVKAQLFFAITSLQEYDVNATIDMFLLEHKLLGRTTGLRLTTLDYDSTTKSLALPTNVLSVSEMYYNDIKLKSYRRDDLYNSSEIGYSLGEDGVIFFNFDINPDMTIMPSGYVADDINVFAKVTVDSISDYEDKWLPVCVKYCLKELYKSQKYRDSELYVIANNDYNRLYRQIGSLNRQKLSMQFMGDPL